MRKPAGIVHLTPVDTPWGAYEVSTTDEGHTVAFGPDGEQVDFGYDDRHGAAVWYMMGDAFAAREDERYTRVYLPMED